METELAYVTVVGVEVLKVFEPGNLSKERVILRMTETADLVNFVLINAFTDDVNVYDLNQHVFWFPSVVATQGDYVRLYTKAGAYSLTEGPYGGKPARFHNFYWGKGSPVWLRSLAVNKESNAVVVIRVQDWIIKKVL